MTTDAMQSRTANSNGVNSTSILIDAANDFASIGRPSPSAINAFQELFYTLALKSTSSDRRTLANLLARGSFTPRSIAYYFCLDRIDIAAPVLRYSPVLNGRDFVSIVMRCEYEHAEVIAQRDDLDLATINAMIAIDDESNSLVNLMRSKQSLMEQSDIRSVLDKAIGGVFFEPSEASKPIDMGLIASDDVTDLSGALLNLASVGGKTGRKHPPVKRKDFSFANILEERLLRHARDSNMEALAYAIERECRLPALYVKSTIETKNAGDLATIFAGLEVSYLIASRLMLMLIPDLGRNVEIFRVVRESYAKLSITECRDYLTAKGARFDQIAQTYPSDRPSHLDRAQTPFIRKRDIQEVRAA